MIKKKRLVTTEFFLLSLVWIVLIASPVFFRDDKISGWQDFRGPFETIVPLFFIFLINRFILVPKLLLKKKSFQYMLSVAGVIAAFTLGLLLITPLLEGSYLPPEINSQRQGPPPPHERTNGDFPPPPEGKGPIPPFANLLIFSLLLVGFDTGLKVSFRLAETEQEKAKLEKENVANQLDALRNQVSPHFFMNTLNNIHALVDIDTEEAKAAIIKLSQMMDYMLYESKSKGISVRKEMEFIESYVELMKLRITDDIDLKMEIPEILPKVKIPPLLTISFIENAFKFGVSYDRQSFIHIKINISDNHFIFNVQNRIHPEIKRNKNSGIGIENTQKRLELLFGNTYELNIDKKDDVFKVNLIIPI